MEANERREAFEERHFTVPEVADMWRLSRETSRASTSDSLLHTHTSTSSAGK
jgi:hypothetical protein